MILITGANGFLGKSIYNILNSNNKLFCLSRTTGDYKVSLETKVPEFNEIFELVIHAAGRAHSIPKTPLEKQLFHDVNVKGTLNLLKGLEKAGVPKKFVFISSVSVYGQEFGIAINEEHSLNAKDPYGLSKIKAEFLVKEWCEKFEVICTILRLPLLIREDPPGNLGTMIKAIDKGYYFNIGGGKARKSMVLVDDVVRFIPKICEIGGVYNLTDGYHPDFNELSLLICKNRNIKPPHNLPLFIAKLIGFIGDIVGKSMPLNSYKLKKITSDLTFDDSKAREIAGWSPHSVLKGIDVKSYL